MSVTEVNNSTMVTIPESCRMAEKPHQCAKCYKPYSSTKFIYGQMKFQIGNTVYACPDCKNTYTTHEELTSHWTIHEKPITCPLCPQRFRDKTGLLQHMKIHSEKNALVVNFPCSECQESFTSEEALADHMKSHQVPAVKLPFQCTECPASFSLQYSLEEHLDSHTGGQQTKLSEMHNSSTQKQALVTRMKVVSRKKSFQCSVCRKGFTHSWMLANHMRVHLGVNRFRCSTCSHSFLSKSALLDHLKTGHTSDKDNQSQRMQDTACTMQPEVIDCTQEEKVNEAEVIDCESEDPLALDTGTPSESNFKPLATTVKLPDFNDIETKCEIETEQVKEEEFNCETDDCQVKQESS